MIIVRLTDGLGNQMFQYALGRKLSQLKSTKLKLDINWFQGTKEAQQKRKYSLSCFNIQENIASQKDLDFFFQRNILISLDSKAKKLFNLPPIKVIKTQKGFQFDKSVFKCPRNVYLKGYWQTEKYFLDIRDILLQDFSLKTEPSSAQQAIIEQITNSESVSIHIRRGDYVANADLNRVHGVCSLDYYKTCVEYIKKSVQEPHFFIFSDDTEWVRENLIIEGKTTFVSDKNSADYDDLRLMSLCQHNIVANSSFSWWGAWLNRNPNKIVCTPKQWFAVKSKNTGDLIPSTWLKF